MSHQHVLSIVQRNVSVQSYFCYDDDNLSFFPSWQWVSIWFAHYTSILTPTSPLPPLGVNRMCVMRIYITTDVAILIFCLGLYIMTVCELLFGNITTGCSLHFSASLISTGGKAWLYFDKSLLTAVFNLRRKCVAFFVTSPLQVCSPLCSPSSISAASE